MNVFAETTFRDQRKKFGMHTSDRRRHCYILGKTGVGKSTLLENMAIQDILNGDGVCILDPHGQFAETALRAVPPSRINDTIYLNPQDTSYPVGFNIFEKTNNEPNHLIVAGIMGVFYKLWKHSWGVRLEYILRNTILSLLNCKTATLLGISRMLVDQSYRDFVIKHIKDPILINFWREEYENYNKRFQSEAIAPVLNKIGQFIMTPMIRNIMGQSRSTFSIRDVMDNKKILIVNLSKGAVGEDNAALLGAMLISRIQMAAMSRVDMPEKERNDFYLYIDEAQNFITESVSTVLSEARKYRVSMCMANQYIAQLSDGPDTTIRDAVFGNVGTIISFRVGAEDAKFLQDEFHPLTRENFTKLPKFNIYIKMVIDGVAGKPFSAVTLPPIPVSGNAKKIIRVSQERWARRKDKVEASINKWLEG